MGFVFSTPGIVTECSFSWFLPRLAGISKALQWYYSGKIFNSEEAMAAGLLHNPHETEDLLPVARQLAHEMVDTRSSISVPLTRRMMWKTLGAADPIEAHRVDTAGINATGSSVLRTALCLTSHGLENIQTRVVASRGDDCFVDCESLIRNMLVKGKK